MHKGKIGIFGQYQVSWAIIQGNMVYSCIGSRFSQEIKITCKRGNHEEFENFTKSIKIMVKCPTFQGHNLWSKQPFTLLQWSKWRSYFILQLCPRWWIPKKCMNWKIWSDEVRDSKLLKFQHLENSANCFDNMKHQSSRAFFTMIQVESMKAMNINVIVHHSSFPESARSHPNSTWAKRYILPKLAPKTGLLQGRIGAFTRFGQYVQ